MRYIVAAVIVALIIPTAVYGQGRSYFMNRPGFAGGRLV
jgi:hypothetical protein